MKQTKKTDTSSRPFITLSGKSATCWGALVICAFVLVFFIGTLVGRGSIKIDLDQKNLVKEINKYSEQIATVTGEDVEIIDDTPELVFYETLQQKDAPKIDLTQNRTKKTAKKTKKVVKNKTTIAKPTVVSVPKKEQIKPAPKKEEKDRSVETKDASVYKYSIQVASFKGLADAKQMVKKFKQKGYSAYYVKAIVRDHEIWYRVRIGAFKDRIDARTTLVRLEKNNIDGFLVTR